MNHEITALINSGRFSPMQIMSKAMAIHSRAQGEMIAYDRVYNSIPADARSTTFDEVDRKVRRALMGLKIASKHLHESL
jgi:hypothetical protein